jgi:hypothetical protein
LKRGWVFKLFEAKERSKEQQALLSIGKRRVERGLVSLELAAGFKLL